MLLSHASKDAHISSEIAQISMSSAGTDPRLAHMNTGYQGRWYQSHYAQ